LPPPTPSTICTALLCAPAQFQTENRFKRGLKLKTTVKIGDEWISRSKNKPKKEDAGTQNDHQIITGGHVCCVIIIMMIMMTQPRGPDYETQ
jgi:hypothetical protein